jgi:TonB family protein
LDDEPPRDYQPLYATLNVLVAPDGTIEKVEVIKSSGNLSFDMASVQAAKRSVFRPEMLDCKPVEGTALFRTSLTPNVQPRGQ